MVSLETFRIDGCILTDKDILNGVCLPMWMYIKNMVREWHPMFPIKNYEDLVTLHHKKQ